MKPKLEIASDLLKTISSLELSPIEVKSLTLMWLSYYPFLLEDFGWEIQVNARLQNIMTEIEKLKVIMEQVQLEGMSAVDLLAQAENNAQTAAVSPASPEKTPAAETKVGEGNLNGDKVQSTSSETPEKPRRKGIACAKKTKKSPKTAVKAKPDDAIAVPPRKGYSKYGKKLGRPPRQKTLTDVASATVVATVSKKPATMMSSQTETEAIMPPVAPSPEVAVQEQIEKLKYGKQYDYDLLYLVNNIYARSPYKLQEEAGVKPVGVVVPYIHQNQPYEMVVYYTDEQARIPLNTAQKYAKNKLLPYKGHNWRVKKSTDDAHLRPVLSDINAIFKKMGGDELKGDYVDGRGQFYGANTKTNLKIRYVCNIALFEQQGDELE
jgi:hypothetical protein